LLFSNISIASLITISFSEKIQLCNSYSYFRVNRIRIFGLTSLAMIAFASNSLLCRAALKQTSIDAATFTFVRMFSGAATLWLIMKLRRGAWKEEGSWSLALALFIYAAAFSFAYLDLSAGTGALLLFGAVQATMILWGFRKGERLDAIQMVGLIVAVTGLVVLMFPGLSAPPLVGSILMVAAGVAWAFIRYAAKLAATLSPPPLATFCAPCHSLLWSVLFCSRERDSITPGSSTP
jgi:hypothetical protein